MTEAEVQPTATFQEAAYRAGVPAPEVRRTSDGRVLADVGGGQVRVYGWVDLRERNRFVDPAAVGRVVAAIHGVGGPSDAPVDAWHSAPVGAERWDALVEHLRRAGAPFAAQLAALRDELVAVEGWIAPAGVVHTCHRDLWADNVLPTADGGVCVIDWENSGPADQRHELACVLYEFGCDDAGRTRELIAAYEEAGGPARLDGHASFSMLIAQLGHIAGIAAEDWLAPNPRSPDRATAAAWVSEILDDPHTPARLERLLTAVAEVPAISRSAHAEVSHPTGPPGAAEPARARRSG